jgi:formylglycine-generating enzyme required for sulfatase activity
VSEPKYDIEVFLKDRTPVKFVKIPAGRFIMGSTDEELVDVSTTRDHTLWFCEKQHEVIISKPFHLGIYAVTQEQYEAVMENNPSHFQGETKPVEQVSWLDAAEFCLKASALTGKAFRLPTEAEWEYACRAGTTSMFNTGERLSYDQANFEKGCYSDYSIFYKDATREVGYYPPNAWGLYDMHGNVWEWCSDWEAEYDCLNNIDPQGGMKGARRTLRGGGWDSDSDYCRSTCRLFRQPQRRRDTIGFRVALDLE